MIDIEKSLPSFAAPPLDEVALAVQFQGIEKFSLAYGAFYERVREIYPNYEEHEPIAVQFETFGRSQESTPAMSLEAISLRRGWYVSADGHQLAQLQPNRLVQNWRRIKGQGEYPRFPEVLASFNRNLEVLSEVLRDLGLSEVRPNQADVTYFNNIRHHESETRTEAFERIFSWPNSKNFSGNLGPYRIEPEAANFNLGFQIFAPNASAPFARLVASAVPAETEDSDKVIRLELRFRGPPEKDCSLEEFLRIGHANIVRTFTDITSEECHAEWKRER